MAQRRRPSERLWVALYFHPRYLVWRREVTIIPTYLQEEESLRNIDNKIIRTTCNRRRSL